MVNVGGYTIHGSYGIKSLQFFVQMKFKLTMIDLEIGNCKGLPLRLSDIGSFSWNECETIRLTFAKVGVCFLGIEILLEGALR